MLNDRRDYALTILKYDSEKLRWNMHGGNLDKRIFIFSFYFIYIILTFNLLFFRMGNNVRACTKMYITKPTAGSSTKT